MQILGISVVEALAWLLAVAFLGAGLYNAFGPQSVRDGFVQWGYPGWWNYVTGGLEIIVAGLIALPATRLLGLGLGALILVAAVGTVLRWRAYGHLPLGLVLLVLVGTDLGLAWF